MARPLRIEFAGAVYHVTARGNAQQDIFVDDTDRLKFLEVLGSVVQRFGWVCHAYCLLPNHYHLLVETPDANLSRGMRQLNGVYTQAFNRRHGRVGHVLQGRFKAIVVEKDSHLLEVARYVVLNPVRAGMVRHPRQWRWSSYRATAGEVAPPGILTTSWILSQFDRRRDRAREAYRQFVRAGYDVTVWDELRGGVLLGTDRFVEKMRPLLRDATALREVPRNQRLAARPTLATLFANLGRDKVKRDQAVHRAIHEHGYTLAEVARHLGLHYSTISRIANRVADERRDARNKT
ncbi:MAG: hypothetical protein BIP78_0098 [Candidatus Bipolaricaulis sibiricus]|uniref:Transposase IS200-like domain-containing protein n=1 Tax=Bipolaricaulis sibiricus TaxID=2501609 RepID=A0A410FS78_BIPS1|nr:MAG: hypothetical protein BIP78_0098 [Candidatus Bipolaricaulis sibiricus]